MGESHKTERAPVPDLLAALQRSIDAAKAARPGESCSTCGGTGLVDWAPGQIHDWEDDQQPCPDCRNRSELGDS